MTEWTEDGRPAMWVTEIEPEFYVEERESWEALAEWRRSLCPDCGRPQAICSNPDGVFGEGFYPQRRICWITAAETVAQRQFSKLHEKARPDESGYLPTDGVAVYADVENANPDDDFLVDPALRALIAAAQQSPREDDQAGEQADDGYGQ